MRANGVYFFACHKDQVAARVIEVAGGLEIVSVSHEYAGFEQTNVLLVVVGPREKVDANEQRVADLIEARVR